MDDQPQNHQHQHQQPEKKCKPLMMALPAISPNPRKRGASHSTLPTPGRRIHRAAAQVAALRSSNNNYTTNNNPTSVSASASNPSPATSFCSNSACRAALVEDFDFCRRCSCCICKRHDENKDPSLWLVCGEDDDPPSPAACGLSCHLQCSLTASGALAEANYRCQNCGTVTNLLGIIKKQLVQAQAARRVDTLYQRLELASKLFAGSERYKRCGEHLQSALDKLVADAGPQSVSTARTLVTRMSCGSAVLDLITRALDLVHEAQMRPEYKLSIKQATWNAVLVSASETKPGIHPVLGYKIWHKKLRGSYTPDPTMTVDSSGDALVIGLQPSTGYMFKAIAFSAKGDEGTCECRCSTSIQEEEEAEAIPAAEESPAPPPLGSPDAPKPGPKAPTPGSKPGSKPGSQLVRARGEQVDEAPRNLSEESGSSFSLEERAKKKTKDLKSVMNDTKDLNSVMNDAQVNSQVKSQVNSPMNNNNNNNHSEESRTDVSQSGGGGGGGDDYHPEAPQNTNNSPDVTSQEGKKSGGTQSCVSVQEPEPTPASAPSPAPKPAKEKNLFKSPPKKRPKGKAPNKGNKEMVMKEPKNELEAMNSNLNLILSGPRAAFLDARSTSASTPGPGSAAGVPAPGGGGSLASISAQAAATAAEIIRKMEAKEPGVKKKYGEEAFDSKMFEQCAKMVRWLERQGHLESEFRMRFFTWLGVKANEEQKRVVNIFIQSMMGDPPSLASQLVDVFDEVIQASRHNMEFDWV